MARPHLHAAFLRSFRREKNQKHRAYGISDGRTFPDMARQRRTRCAQTAPLSILAMVGVRPEFLRRATIRYGGTDRYTGKHA